MKEFPDKIKSREEMCAERWWLLIMGRGARLNKQKRSRLNLNASSLCFLFYWEVSKASPQSTAVWEVCQPLCFLHSVTFLLARVNPSSLKLFPVGSLEIARKMVNNIYASLSNCDDWGHSLLPHSTVCLCKTQSVHEQNDGTLFRNRSQCPRDYTASSLCFCNSFSLLQISLY